MRSSGLFKNKMAEKLPQTDLKNLPTCAAEFIRLVIRKMRYRKKVRQDVQAELVAHFEDELKDCKTDEEKEKKAGKLIADFGDAKLLGKLIRRGKKRSRPLWLKAIIHTVQIFGIIILYLLICVGWLSIGKPNIKIDLVSRLNKQVSNGKDEQLNARPYFDKAAELANKDLPNVLLNSYWPADMNEEQRDALLKLLDENKESLDALRLAVEKPYYWITYSSEVGQSPEGMGLILLKTLPPTLYTIAAVTQNMMKPMGDYRQLARIMAYDILYKSYYGDIDGAVSDYLVLVKFGDYQQGKGLLIEQLVGIAIEALAHGKIVTILEKVDVPADILDRIQVGLKRNTAGPRRSLVWKGKRHSGTI